MVIFCLLLGVALSANFNLLIPVFILGITKTFSLSPEALLEEAHGKPPYDKLPLLIATDRLTDGQNISVKVKLAKTYLSLNMPEQAEEAIRQAIDMIEQSDVCGDDPELREKAYGILADALRAQRKLDEALAVVDWLIAETNGKDHVAFGIKAQIFSQQRRFEDAVSAILCHIQLCPNDTAYTQLAQIYLCMANVEIREDSLSSALKYLEEAERANLIACSLAPEGDIVTPTQKRRITSSLKSIRRKLPPSIDAPEKLPGVDALVVIAGAVFLLGVTQLQAAAVNDTLHAVAGTAAQTITLGQNILSWAVSILAGIVILLVLVLICAPTLNRSLGHINRSIKADATDNKRKGRNILGLVIIGLLASALPLFAQGTGVSVNPGIHLNGLGVGILGLLAGGLLMARAHQTRAPPCRTADLAVMSDQSQTYARVTVLSRRLPKHFQN